MSPPPAGTIETADPGSQGNTGWSYFWGGQLKECALWDLDKMLRPSIFCGRIALVENQVIHRDTKRPADIITLAHTAGRIAERLGWERVQWIDPHTWKRNLDPDIMCERVICALSTEERRVYFATADKIAEELRHNVIDSIGIGLWKLRRLPK